MCGLSFKGRGDCGGLGAENSSLTISRYTGPMNAQSSLADFQQRTELRAGKRFSAILLAFVEAEGTAYPACLRNISSAGALVEAEAGFPIGSKVLFRRAFAAVAAEVVWARGGRFGLAFERRLTSDEVAALSRRIVPKKD